MKKQMDIASVHDIGEKLTDIAKKCKADKAFCDAIMADGWKLLDEAGMSAKFTDRSIKVDVKLNSDDVYYFILPTDPNTVMKDESLTMLNAAKSVTAGTIGSVGTASTAFSCLGCYSTVGSAGTAS